MTAPHEQRETSAASRPRAAILGALRWAAAIGLLVLVGRKLWSQWSVLREHPLSFSAGSTALSLALICVFMLLCAEAWRLLLLELGTPVPRPSAFRIVYLSNLAKYLPGGVWNLVGRVALCHEAKIPPVRASISVLLDLACQVVAATLLALPMLAGRARLGHPALLVLVGVLMIAAMHPRVMNAVIGLTRLVGRPLPELPFRYAFVLKMLAFYVFNWGLLGLGFAALCQATLPDTLRPDQVVRLAGAFVLAWNAGVAAFFLPGGIGAREAALVFLLGDEFPPGWPATMALVARVWTLVAEVGYFGLASLVPRERVEPRA